MEATKVRESGQAKDPKGAAPAKQIALKKEIDPKGIIARRLFLADALVFVVFGVAVFVAWLAGVSMEAQMIGLCMMGIVFVLQALLYAAVHYSSANEPARLLKHSRRYISRMVAIMKIGTTFVSLLCMMVLMGYSFLFLSFAAPWVAGFVIMLVYAGGFSLCLVVPGCYYTVKICLSSRESRLERRVVCVVAVLTALMTVSGGLTVLGVMLGASAASLGVVLGWYAAIFGAFVIMDSFMLGFELRQVAKCLPKNGVHVFSILFWVVVGLHAPYWVILVGSAVSAL